MQDNLLLKAEKKFTFSKPAFIILMISVLLTVILAFATVRNINRSQKLMELSFLRQGMTMIHAFEAGTRTSMLFRRSAGHNPLVDLATEVLKDKGIAFIRIVDEDNSVVVSEGDVSHSSLKKDFNLTMIGDEPVFTINWPDNIFEIKKRFHPIDDSLNGRSMMEMRWEQWNFSFKPKGEMYISVGFYTKEYGKTRLQDMYHTIFMLVMLLLLFFAGLYFLFLYQRIRVTHATLLNTQLYAKDVLESIPEALIILDQGGQLISCNKNAEQLFKRRSSELIGRQFLDIYPACPPEMLTSPENIVEKDAELPIAGDTFLPVKMGSAQLMDHQGKRIGRVLVLRDVGEIRLMEQQLEHSRRLAALGSMAAGIAHEVRNPLGTLRGLAHFFGTEEGASAACKEYSKFMISEVDRLNLLVTELLQFGAPREVRHDRIEVKSLVEKITALLDKDFKEKNIRFGHQFAEDTELYGDHDLLLQVLLNVLKNSIEATPCGGEVSLDVSCNDEICRLAVTDSGAGMSEETRNKLFDPFYTTKKKGTGLGLAVSHRIVERHNGRFEIRSAINAGTTITMVLPHKVKQHDRTKERETT